MGSTADGYPWIEDLDQPADMSAWTLMAADAAQAVLDAHEAAANPHPGYATDADVAGKVSKAGDTMTGDLTISKAGHTGVHVAGPSGVQRFLRGVTNGVLRWNMNVATATPETGGNAGSDFSLSHYDDSGAGLGNVLTFLRASGLGTVKGDPVAPLGIVTKQYADAADAGKVSKAGDTMTGNLTMGGAPGAFQVIYWTASGRKIIADPTHLNGDIAICDGNLTPAPLWVGALDVYGADDSTVRLRANGGQVEVVDTAGTATAPVAHANATYGNQSMTLAQKAAFQHFAPRPADDDPVAVLRGIVAAGFTAESLEAAGVEMIRDTDGEAVGFHHERLLALLVAAVARTADGAP